MRMKSRKILSLLLFLFSAIFVPSARSSRFFKITPETSEYEKRAIEFLDGLDAEMSTACNKYSKSNWNFKINITDETEKASTAALNDFNSQLGIVQKRIMKEFPDWKSRTFCDPYVKRAFDTMSIGGPANMIEEEVEELSQLGTEMESAHAQATACGDYPNKDRSTCKLMGSGELHAKMFKTVKMEEIEWYWSSWQDGVAEQISTSKYKDFVTLQNTKAKENGFEEVGALWAESFHDGSENWSLAYFQQDMQRILNEFRPYYEKLHAYIRFRMATFPNFQATIAKHAPYLPLHLAHIWPFTTKPYPNASSLDLGDAMKKQNYTPKLMFQKADEFFISLGLPPMTQTFWEKSMIEKPKDRKVSCHPIAMDACTGGDNEEFSVLICAKVNQWDLALVHHEMGHIHYFMQFKKNHFAFRDSANPGFNEAVGDALALAVVTPKHIQCVLKLDLGLNISCADGAANYDVTETDINFLYSQALSKLFPIPFAYSVEAWRWGVFNGSIPESEYNAKWWEIKKLNEGTVPPSIRPGPGTSSGLDAAAIWHVPANFEYIRYFVSYVLMFQFYEALCRKAGEYDPNNPNSKPLYHCDFSGSKEAGNAIAEMMKTGYKEYWPNALEKLTGSRKYDIKPMLDYFAPLFKFFDDELKKNGVIPKF